MSIHPTSVISKEAELGRDVEVGPFCIIRGRVRIGDGSVLESHVSVGNEWGVVEIGRNNRIGASSAIGGTPQDLSYKGEPTRLEIGDNNLIREYVTVNCGTAKAGSGTTRIGSDCMIMAYSHIAHDCQIGNHVVLANLNQLAGHAVVADHVKTGGMCGFNQFVRIGKYAFIAGDSAVNKDVAPFTIAHGRHAVMRATNRIGLERAGFDKEEIDMVNRAIRIITKGGDTLEEALERISVECKPLPAVLELMEFARTSSRGLAL
jgi:UDP-N-acetylglucosamine acyltransferase